MTPYERPRAGEVVALCDGSRWLVVLYEMPEDRFIVQSLDGRDLRAAAMSTQLIDDAETEDSFDVRLFLRRAFLARPRRRVF